MTSSLAARIAKAEMRVSPKYVTFRRIDNGEERYVPVGQVFDAWFNTLLGQVPNLDPAVSEAIAHSKPPNVNRHGDMVVGVYAACRAIWFPQPPQEEGE
ncbi:MAG TPA: hypothetical protein VGQ58_07165 [Candidatus Limnocylindrales bacterium]|jgi:hypothetical protein|nr:hypothetical protein [Candidatus Limnocylindrales bacterium]